MATEDRREEPGVPDLDDADTVPPAPGSANELFAAVYDRLKAMAVKHLAGKGEVTLQTTVLVHELYLRMQGSSSKHFRHPSQFFTYASRAMRHLLVDRARERARQRAGGDWQRTTLTGSNSQLVIESAERALALDEALRRLEEEDARAARVVELLYFGGLTLEETAGVLGLTRRTIDRDWRFARAFLKTALD